MFDVQDLGAIISLSPCNLEAASCRSEEFLSRMVKLRGRVFHGDVLFLRGGVVGSLSSGSIFCFLPHFRKHAAGRGRSYLLTRLHGSLEAVVVRAFGQLLPHLWGGNRSKHPGGEEGVRCRRVTRALALRHPERRPVRTPGERGRRKPPVAKRSVVKGQLGATARQTGSAAALSSSSLAAAFLARRCRRSSLPRC